MPTFPIEATAPHPVAAQPDKRARRTLLGVTLGNGLEVYDWTCYAVFAPFFASQVFDADDPTSALLSTLLVFGAGFVIRPFGGILFGWLADRHGRKTSLIAAILIASAGMILIACVPTYEVAGIGAGLLLLLARLLQGLAHTGEVAAAYTYVAEASAPDRRGLWSSSIYVSGFAAIMVATVLGAILNTILDDSHMTSWGWRIPFLIGAGLGLLTLVLRRNMDESSAYTKAAAEEDNEAAPHVSLARELWIHRGAGARVFLIMASLTAMFYAWAVSGPTWAIKVGGIAPTTALWCGVVALTISLPVLPLAGALSDRIGRRPTFYIYGVGAAMAAFPLDHLGRQGVWQFCVAMTVALGLFAFAAAILPAVLSELFPTGVRASGIALPYALSAVAFGGTAPYLQQWTAQNDVSQIFVAYLAVAALIGAAVMYFSPETRGIRLDTINLASGQKEEDR